MAYSVNWITKVITIPTSDLIFVSGTRYTLPMFDFLTEIRRLEWEPTEGLWAPLIVDHSNTRTDFAGSNYASFDEIINGYTVQFSGAATRVDLVDSNNNLVDVLIDTGVSVVPSNSTGLTYSKQNQDLAFVDARVWVDTNNGTAGSTYPTGTPAQPCLTFAGAIGVVQGRGLPYRFRGIGTATVTAGANLDGYDLLGAGPELANFTIESGVSTQGLIVSDATLTAALDGDVSLKDCTLGAITGFSGEMFRCSLAGNVTVDATRTDLVSVHECNSEIAGINRPYVDVNGAVADILIDRWTGGIEIRNMTAGNSITINGMGASVRIAASCTDGTIKVRGDTAIENLAVANPNLTVLVYEGQENSKWERVEKLFTRLGLNPDNAITDVPSGITSEQGDINIVRTGDGVTSSTLTRQ